MSDVQQNPPKVEIAKLSGFAAFRTLAGLVERLRIGAAAGLTHEGARDVGKALGYKANLTATDFRARFRRGGIARRIVTAFPDATWRGYPELIEDETNPELTEFEAAWIELNKRLKVWPNLRKADILAGISRYAVLLIGAPGNADTPLPERMKPEDVKFLRPLSEEDATIETYENDLQSARYAKPLVYAISRTDLNNPGRKTAVHYSRIHHISDGVLDEDIFGTPRMEASWNYLDDLQKVVGAGAEAFWKRADRGFQFKLDPDIDLTPDEKTEMAGQMDEFIHGLRRVLRTRGVDTQEFGSDVANFASNASAILELIAATAEIPQRILLGSERGELASTQDDDNWKDRVDDRRMQYAGPYCVRPLVDLFIKHGVLPPVKDYDVRWPVQEPSEDERADLAMKYAKVNKDAGETVVLPNEIRDWALQRDPIDEQELADRDEQDADPAVADEEFRAAARRRKRRVQLKWQKLSSRR